VFGVAAPGGDSLCRQATHSLDHSGGLWDEPPGGIDYDRQAARVNYSF